MKRNLHFPVLVLVLASLALANGVSLEEEVDGFRRINAYLKEKLPDNDFQNPSTITEDMKINLKVLRDLRHEEEAKVEKFSGKKIDASIFNACVEFTSIMKVTKKEDYCDIYMKITLPFLNRRVAMDYSSMDRLKKIIDVQNKARQEICNVPLIAFEEDPEQQVPELPDFQINKPPSSEPKNFWKRMLECLLPGDK